MTDETPEVTTTEADAKTVETPEPKAEPKAEPKRDRVQERIDELIWKTRDLERQLTEARKPKEEPPKEIKRPTLEESNHDEDAHKRAMDKYYEDLIEQRAAAAAEKIIKDREAKREAETRNQSFAEKFGKLSSEQRATAESAIVTEFAAGLIKESEVGPELAVYLGENRDIAEKIARLPESQQAREIGRLEARLEGKAEAKPSTTEVPEPKVSKAPPPVPKIEATDSARSISSTDPESDKLSDAEWVKAENKRLAAKRKAK